MAGQLNRPLRWAIAAAEVLLAAVAVAGAVLVWRGGFYDIAFPAGGRAVTTTRMLGDHAGIAVGLGLVAAFLVLDAVRECLLAARVRPRPAERARDREAA